MSTCTAHLQHSEPSMSNQAMPQTCASSNNHANMHVHMIMASEKETVIETTDIVPWAQIVSNKATSQTCKPLSKHMLPKHKETVTETWQRKRSCHACKIIVVIDLYHQLTFFSKFCMSSLRCAEAIRAPPKCESQVEPGTAGWRKFREVGGL